MVVWRLGELKGVSAFLEEQVLIVGDITEYAKMVKEV